MPRLNASLWIDAAPDQVYKTCQAPPAPLLPSGGPRLVIPDPPGLPGSRYLWEFRRLGLSGRLECILTDAEPGRLLRFRGHDGWHMEADLTLQPEKGGTRLHFCMQYRFPVPLRWVVPGGLIRLGVWHGLHQVKVLTEQTPRVHTTDPIVM